MTEATMKNEIKKIINESACNEEAWVTVEERFGDTGINVLFEMDFPEVDE